VPLLNDNTKILIVDDSHFLNQIIIRQLGSQDFSARSATTVAEAKEFIRDWQPSIIITNSELSDSPTSDFIAYINLESPMTQVILMGNSSIDELKRTFSTQKIAQYAQKPIPKDKLIEMAYQLRTHGIETTGTSAVILDSPREQAWEIHVKTCYVCAFDNVKVFVRKEGALSENWNYGLFPDFQANAGFQNFDFLQSYVSVCPSCLFASNSLDDFSEKNQHLDQSFNPEAKKVLAMGISGRRRILGLSPDEKYCLSFENSNRNSRTVIDSFKLAQKCANALVLGGKPGAHADAAIAYLLQAALVSTNKRPELLRSALQLFEGQLKVPSNSRELNSKCYYFCIMIHFALGESQKANTTKENLEYYYSSIDVNSASEAEIEWNQRLLHIWQCGVDINTQRYIG
jgi:ActR/RegA family two-component response regulator